MDPKDYVKIAEQLNDASDVNNMLNFILYLVVNGHLSNKNTTLSDANWRARRLMVKVITKTPVVPTSLMVTGVSMPPSKRHCCSVSLGRYNKKTLPPWPETKGQSGQTVACFHSSYSRRKLAQC